GLEARGDVHFMAVETIRFDDYLTDIDADTENGLIRVAIPDSVVPELALHIDGKMHRLNRAIEGRLDRIALDVEDMPFVVADHRLEVLDAAHHPPVGAELVPLHRLAVIDDVGEQDGRRTMSDFFPDWRTHNAQHPRSLNTMHSTIRKDGTARAWAQQSFL